MSVRLTPDQGIDSLVLQIRKFETPLEVESLDLTNCIHLETDEVIPIIKKCAFTNSLRCLSCSIQPGALVTLILGHMRHLVRLELTLVCEVVQEVGEYPDKDVWVNRYILPDLHHIYVEMAYDASYQLFATILRESVNLKHLHVHFLRGSFLNALCEEALRLEKFTFTSEQPPHCQSLVSPLGLFNCISVCANVEHRRPGGIMSVFTFHHLAEDSGERRRMPNQATVVAVHTKRRNLTPELMLTAFRGHDWSFTNPPSTLVPGLDVKELLQDATLKKLRFLQSLSATPCGLRRLSALRLLAQHCPHFGELDVRYENGGLVRCLGCEVGVPLDSDAPTNVPGGTVGFQKRLDRLTLSGIRFPVDLHFIECCGPTTTVRLSGCASTSSPRYEHLAKVLSETCWPTCLVLRHGSIDIEDASVLAMLSSVHSLLYLYLLSTVSCPNEVAETCFRALAAALPRLRFLHYHYLTLNGVERSLTLVRSKDDPEDTGNLLRNAPCYQCCSTATFVGLAKPLNREFVPFA
ncbi:hypothetical protein MRX96_022102 [Rhipicephalus microplus]